MDTFILIPGRTADQGCGISEGKFGKRYRDSTGSVQMCRSDAGRLGLAAGDRVRIRSDFGQVELPVTVVDDADLPPGLLFLAYGEFSSRLMDGETHGSGMPTSKGLDVEVVPVERTEGNEGDEGGEDVGRGHE